MTPRFFVDQALDVALTANSPIMLPEAATHHALRVLRMGTGESLALFNGNGRPYQAKLEVHGKKALAHILEQGQADPVRAVKLRLTQCLSASEKMDWTLEKATELGVDEIVVVASERSKVRLDADRTEKKLERWRDLILAACGQCGRNTIPSLTAASNLTKTLGRDLEVDPHTTTNANPALLFTPGEYPTLSRQLRSVAASSDLKLINLIIGPESGFSPPEIETAIAAGARPTSLGWRVLRTETAGPAVMAVADAWFSDRPVDLR